MSLVSLDPEAPTPVAGACRDLTSMPAGDQLAWLFRETLGHRRSHPLWPVVALRLGADLHDHPLHHGEAPALPLPDASHPPLLTPAELSRRVGKLPSLPAAARDLLGALRDESRPVADLAVRLGRDPALAARTLRLANSSFYGATGRVVTLEDALSVLGLRTVATLVGAAALTRAIDEPPCEGFDFEGHWRHAIAVAGLAHRLAPRLLVDPDIAFTAGLLHDLGRLALACVAPEAMARSLRLACETGVSLCRLETVVVGCDHAMAGRTLARHWHLPEPLVAGMEHHHRPACHAGGAAGHHEVDALCDVVHLADALAHAGLRGDGPIDHVPPVDVEAWMRLGLDVAQCQELLSALESDIDELCEVLAR